MEWIIAGIVWILGSAFGISMIAVGARADRWAAAQRKADQPPTLTLVP